MTRWLQSQRERILFSAGLIAAGICIIAYVVSGNAARPLAEVSSDSYMPLAISLYERGTFTLSTSTPYLLEAADVPGYPLFLALTAVPWGNVLPALLIQAFLFAISGVLLYRLFEDALSERVRFFGTLIFLIEPFTAFTIAQALSEALFLFLLISALYATRRAFERKALPLFFLSAVLFAAATLTRPILLYALPFLVLAPAAYAFRKSARMLITALLISLFGAFLVLAPWMYRNHEAFGGWTFSTKGAYTLYFYDVALLMQYKDGIPASEASTQLFERARAVYPELRAAPDLRAAKYAPYLMRESEAIIKTAPFQFMKVYAVSVGTFFLSDGYRLLWSELTGSTTSLPNITKAIATGDGGTLVSYAREHMVQVFFLFFGLLFWGITLLFALGAVFVECRQSSKARFALIVCVLFIAYFAFITGPVAQARYRIVITPFLFMLAAYGASMLIPIVRRRLSSRVIER